MLFGSTSDPVIARERILRVQAEDQARRARFQRRHLLMADDYEDLVAVEVRHQFADPARADRVAVQADSTLNAFKYVATELYQSQGAKRVFLQGTEPDPVYEQIKSLYEFDLLHAEVKTALGTMNDCLVQVLPGVVDDVGNVGLPRVRVFRPHEVSVIPWDSDPSEPRVVSYEVLAADGQKSTVVWTDAEHYVVGSGGRVEVGAEGGKNPLGRLPFVACHRGLRADSFWDASTGEDLVSFALRFLASWSAINHLIHNQSFKQLVATNVSEGWIPPDKQGPGCIWVITRDQSPAGNATIEAIDLHSDPASLISALRAKLAMRLAAEGVNAERFIENPGQAPASGLARYLERQNLLERRKAIKPHLLEAEYAIADLYRDMWNWNHKDQIAPGAEFACELIDETVVMSPNEEAELRRTQLENIKKERELGLKTEAEQIAAERDISIEEAERLAANLKAKPEIFAYDQENGIVTIDEARAAKGLGPHPNPAIGRLTVPELRGTHPEFFQGGSAPSQG